MNCTQLQSLFSARLDGELDDAAQERFESHVAGCSTCTARWQTFQDSIGALRASGVAQVSDEYLDTLVNSVLESAQRTVAVSRALPGAAGSRWSPVLSHGLALLAGAAATFLIFSANRGRLPHEPGPASVVASSELQLESAEQELIATELTAVTIPEPRIEYVDRVVERVVTISLPAPPAVVLRSAELNRVLRFVATAYAEMRVALDDHSAALLREAEILAALQVSEPREVAPGASDAEPQPSRRARRALTPRFSSDEALLIRRQGISLTLETNGSLDEVVPALIAELSNEDPRVTALVQDRLREIWSTRTGANWNDAPFGPEQEPPSRTGWSRWTASSVSPPVRPDPTEQWTTWWAAQSSRLAQAGI